jgi:hypothetical protein
VRVNSMLLLLLSVISAHIFTSQAYAGTVDQEFKSAGEDSIDIIDHTRESCDKGDNVTVMSTTDGGVILKPKRTKYFRIDDSDNYTKSGGWYWKCGNTPERSRISGANVIKAIRKANGVIDWYSVKKH